MGKRLAIQPSVGQHGAQSIGVTLTPRLTAPHTAPSPSRQIVNSTHPFHNKRTPRASTFPAYTDTTSDLTWLARVTTGPTRPLVAPARREGDQRGMLLRPVKGVDHGQQDDARCRPLSSGASRAVGMHASSLRSMDHVAATTAAAEAMQSCESCIWWQGMDGCPVPQPSLASKQVKCCCSLTLPRDEMSARVGPVAATAVVPQPSLTSRRHGNHAAPACLLL